MEVTPQAIATTTFRVIKKGYDPDEVRSFLGQVSELMGKMEIRTRQAVAKAERLGAAPPPPAPAESPAVATEPAVPAPTPIEAQPLPSGADTISRTLLLAQQTADETVAKAQREAADLTAEAEAEAMALIDQARNEARSVGDEEKARIEGEIHDLLAKLEFLRNDIDQLEMHSANHRQRVLESAEALRAVAEDPAAGFSAARRPVLSGAADALRSDFAKREAPASGGFPDDADESTVDVEPVDSVDSNAPDSAAATLFDHGDAAKSGVTAGDDGDALDLAPSAHEVAMDADITAEVPLVQS